jgi:hypothetical protein
VVAWLCGFAVGQLCSYAVEIGYLPSSIFHHPSLLPLLLDCGYYILGEKTK